MKQEKQTEKRKKKKRTNKIYREEINERKKITFTWNGARVRIANVEMNK